MYIAMKTALCFAVCLLLIMGLEAEAASSIAQAFKKGLEIHRSPRQVPTPECQELAAILAGVDNAQFPSTVDQACVDAAGSSQEALCSSACQSFNDLLLQCTTEQAADSFYEALCGPDGFNSAGTATSQDCQELNAFIDDVDNAGIPSAIDQACVDALDAAESEESEEEAACSSVCQSLYDLVVECLSQEVADDIYEGECGSGGFNSGSTSNSAVYTSLVATSAFLAVFAAMF